MVMATMTATLAKASDDARASSVMKTSQHLYSDMTFRSLSLAETESSMAISSSPHFLFKSPSHYDNASSLHSAGTLLAHTGKLSSRYSPSGKSESTSAVATVITTLLPKVEPPCDETTSLSSSPSSCTPEHNSPIPQMSDKMTNEEFKQVSRLIYGHFCRGNCKYLNETSSVPVGYDEEDPNTWPSNWLSQVPSMILEPENYISQKPSLNVYQRSLIRRIAIKHDSLVRFYWQQIKQGSKPYTNSKNLDSNNNLTKPFRYSSYNVSDLNSSLVSAASKPEKSKRTLVKSASFFSSTYLVTNANKPNDSINNYNGSQCHPGTGKNNRNVNLAHYKSTEALALATESAHQFTRLTKKNSSDAVIVDRTSGTFKPKAFEMENLSEVGSSDRVVEGSSKLQEQSRLTRGHHRWWVMGKMKDYLRNKN